MLSWLWKTSRLDLILSCFMEAKEVPVDSLMIHLSAYIIFLYVISVWEHELIKHPPPELSIWQLTPTSDPLQKYLILLRWTRRISKKRRWVGLRGDGAIFFIGGLLHDSEDNILSWKNVPLIVFNTSRSRMTLDKFISLIGNSRLSNSRISHTFSPMKFDLISLWLLHTIKEMGLIILINFPTLNISNPRFPLYYHSLKIILIASHTYRIMFKTLLPRDQLSAVFHQFFYIKIFPSLWTDHDSWLYVHLVLEFLFSLSLELFIFGICSSLLYWLLVPYSIHCKIPGHVLTRL